MTKKLDFYAWNPFHYRADTTHLTREENFAYRVILDEIFITAQDSCRIPDDDEYLRKVAKASAEEWPAIRRTLIDGPRALLQKRRGFIYSARLREEIRRAQTKTHKNSKAAAERWHCDSDADVQELDADAVRTHSKRNETKTKKKKPPVSSKTENSSPNGELKRGAAIEKAMLDLGVNVHRRKTWPKALALWLERATEAEILEAIEGNRDSITTADRPLQYTNAIVAGIVKRRAPEPEPLAEVVEFAGPQEPSPADLPHKFRLCYLPCADQSPHCLHCRKPEADDRHEHQEIA